MSVTFILTFVLNHTFRQLIFSFYSIGNMMITMYLLALGNC